MGARVRSVAVVVVILLVGAFLGSTVGQWWPVGDAATATRGVDPEAVPPPPAERVLVEVLNGGGRDGMARRATDLLRDRGFDVVYWGNTTFDHDASVVIDRVGRPELARSVAQHLRIRRVLSEPDSNLYLDVTVVLGEAWSPGPAERTQPEEAVPAWWDLRRFFRDDEAPRPEGPGASTPTGRMADPGREPEGS